MTIDIYIIHAYAIVLHLAQALYCRLWFMLPTAVLACIAEVIGWAARLWSSKNPSLLDPFLIQYARPSHSYVRRAVLNKAHCDQNHDDDHRAHAARRGQLRHPRAAHRAPRLAIQPAERDVV